MYDAACCVSLEAVYGHADCVRYCVLHKRNWRRWLLPAADRALYRALQCSWQDFVRSLCSLPSIEPARIPGLYHQRHSISRKPCTCKHTGPCILSHTLQCLFLELVLRAVNLAMMYFEKTPNKRIWLKREGRPCTLFKIG